MQRKSQHLVNVKVLKRQLSDCEVIFFSSGNSRTFAIIKRGKLHVIKKKLKAGIIQGKNR